MLKNFVLETANAPGTATTINLAGAVSGRRSFASSFATGATVWYIMDDGTQSEAGYGTFTSGAPNTLARSTVLYDSVNGETTPSRRNFTGSTRVYCEVPASQLCYVDNNGLMIPSPQKMHLNSAAGVERRMILTTNEVIRWDVVATSAAESGSNLGSNFQVRNYDDSGALIGSPIAISRATGDITMSSAILNIGIVGNGRNTLPNGKIMQWGTVSAAATSGAQNFPQAFGNTTGLVVQLTPNANYSIWYSSVNVTGFNWGVSAAPNSFTYMAIGNQ
jgi:hypothetical protein